MIARVQRLIVLALLAAQAIATGLALMLSVPALMVCVPAVAITGYVAVLGVEFWILRRAYAVADPFRPDLARLTVAWAGEVFAAPRAFLWRQPFLVGAFPDHVSARRGQRGVILVHGFFCNRAIWNPWLSRLKRAGVPFMAVTLEPILGSIDDYRDTIGAAVTAMHDATSLAPVIVAHSMGGLAVRAWLATQADATVVHRVVTIATPHAGTRMARRSIARNVGEMRIGSVWLSDLRSREPAEHRSRFVCFWSHCDNIVFPTRTATLPEADNRHLPATAHVKMALHPEIFEAVLELVA